MLLADGQNERFVEEMQGRRTSGSAGLSIRTGSSIFIVPPLPHFQFCSSDPRHYLVTVEQGKDQGTALSGGAYICGSSVRVDVWMCGCRVYLFTISIQYSTKFVLAIFNSRRRSRRSTAAAVYYVPLWRSARVRTRQSPSIPQFLSGDYSGCNSFLYAKTPRPPVKPHSHRPLASHHASIIRSNGISHSNLLETNMYAPTIVDALEPLAPILALSMSTLSCHPFIESL